VLQSSLASVRSEGEDSLAASTELLVWVERKGWLEIEKGKGRRNPLSNKGRRETGLGKS